MAVIGKIRKRIGLLIACIGGAMVLFILGDVLTNNRGLIASSNDTVGKVNGEKLDYQDFQNRLNTLIDNYKKNTKKESLDPGVDDQLRDQAWDMFINENTLGKEYKKLGMNCSPDELLDMMTGKDPHPQIKQAFSDPKTGAFDPKKVNEFLLGLPDRDEELQQQWATFEKALKDERVAEKYKNLIKGGVNVTTAEAKRFYEDQLTSISIKFINLNYNTVPDTAVKVSDDDLKKYYNEHTNEYKVDGETRKVEYVIWDVNPSGIDKTEINKKILDRAEELRNEKVDSSYIAVNSDLPLDSSWHQRNSLSPSIDSFMFNANVGDITQPYEEGGYVKISKLTAVKFTPDSVKARHILLKADPADSTDHAMKLADSLKTLIKKGQKFADLAQKYSEDPGSKIKGGDLGWFKPGMMVAPFQDACFNGKKGDMPIVKSQFGVHLIEILDQGKLSKQVQVSTLALQIISSKRTDDSIYNIARDFAMKNNTASLFDTATRDMPKRIADQIHPSDHTVPPLENSRELVKWAYSAKIGEISKAFSFGNKYVVAKLSAIREKGISPMEQVKEQVLAGAKKNKKAQILIEKINKAMPSKSTTLEEAAQKLGTNVLTADNINFNAGYINNLGRELRVIGTIFTLKQNEVSKPIQGDNGVVVAMVTQITKAPETKDYTAQKTQLLNTRKQNADGSVQNALRALGDIRDNRGKF